MFTDGILIYQRLFALPRIRWAGTATTIEQPALRIQAMKDRTVPDDTVLLDAPGPAGAGGTATVNVREETSDGMIVDVRAPGTGYLVVADALQHGWVAQVDGRTATLRAADHACVAVLVPGGHHLVRLSYHPKGWNLGLIVSALSALVLIGVGVLGARRPGRSIADGVADPSLT